MSLRARLLLVIGLTMAAVIPPAAAQTPPLAPLNQNVGPRDWPMLGGTTHRNNAVVDSVPTEWEFSEDSESRSIKPGRNVKWVAKLGSMSHASPVIANGHVYVGTNNGAGWLREYPPHIDLGVMLALRAGDGDFVWQYSSPKLQAGRVHDWPMQGICSTPVVEGERLWFVSNRGEVVCLDTEGFHDQEDDGPVVDDHIEIGFWPHDLKNRRDPHYADAMRIVFAHHGEAWPSYERHTAIPDKRNEWHVGRYKQPPQYRIRQLDDAIEVYAAGDESGTKLFEFETNLLAKLDGGQLSPMLRVLLESTGVELPATPRIDVLEAGNRWSLVTEADNGAETLILEVADTRLLARKRISPQTPRHADVVWRLDMMNQLGVRQHNMANCSPAIWGDLLFVCTSNGVDETHINIPAAEAPSFLCLDKHTGEVIWSDNSPGKNILHGQWSSPAVSVLGGVPQVIFAGGDGYVRSFRANRGTEGKPTLLWKFDCNAKDAKWSLGGTATRNNIIAAPVIYHGKVYVAVGQDPEHGDGVGVLWCIDPNRRGDVSPELLLDAEGNPTELDRFQASGSERLLLKRRFTAWDTLVVPKVSAELREMFRQAGVKLPDDAQLHTTENEKLWHVYARVNGEPLKWSVTRYHRSRVDPWIELRQHRNVHVIANPNSAMIWKYDKYDLDRDGKVESHETMHRSLASPVIRNGLLIQSDYGGYCHCLDAATGRPHWVADLLAMAWGTPLIAGNHVYVPDEDGDIAIIGLSANPAEALLDGLNPSEPSKEMMMPSSVNTSPVVADGVLYISAREYLFAIEQEKLDTGRGN